MNAKKVLSMSLVSAMALSVVGCSSNSSSKSTETTTAKDGAASTAATEGTTAEGTKAEGTTASSNEKRTIRLGTWWDMYYTSAHNDINDQPNVTKPEIAEMQLNNMREIEKKYNVEFYADNMTWDGIIASINASIMAGKPDEDIYLSDLQFGVPAVLKGYALNTKDYGATEKLAEANVVKGLKIGTSDDVYLFQEQSISTNAVYCLGFNMDMIKEAGLENPQDLYDKGEWTWDKFMEYMKVLTKDTDGDGATDVYGYGGWWTIFLKYMLMANDAQIAATNKEGLSDPKTIETLEYIYNMYNVEKVARPWNSESWDANNDYSTGEMAFWIGANWIASNNGDADTSKIPFEVGYVNFPMGPSCDGDYNTKATDGNWYFIPKGTEDPEKVFNVMYDWINWYNFDNDYRDDNEWAQNVTYSPNAEDPERNFNILLESAKKEAYDPWGSLQVDGVGVIGLNDIMVGEKTAAQYVEENKQILQEALDTLFK